MTEYVLWSWDGYRDFERSVDEDLRIQADDTLLRLMRAAFSRQPYGDTLFGTLTMRVLVRDGNGDEVRFPIQLIVETKFV